jgi:hypothetical protein
MPPEVAARVFEPFFTITEIGKWSGLGLSQVYGFIAQSDGGLLLESEVGKGTTVIIYLPAVAGATNDMHTDTVLIVEDEPYLMEWLLRFSAASVMRCLPQVMAMTQSKY